jgi:hypothetical protein
MKSLMVRYEQIKILSVFTFTTKVSTCGFELMIEEFHLFCKHNVMKFLIECHLHVGRGEVMNEDEHEELCKLRPGAHVRPSAERKISIRLRSGPEEYQLKVVIDLTKVLSF